LAGFATWGATAYPVPLSWGETFSVSVIAVMSDSTRSSMGSDASRQRPVSVATGLGFSIVIPSPPR
ncbi:hypothetical protein ACC691_37195, partial [Rhizobium johnstonii]|uniref:hypothetical protein n=1 Tax=Rhizobium johnstonii TaxID=3019933 RepID=UPI003F977B82